MKLSFAISAVHRNLPRNPEDRHLDHNPALSPDINKDHM
jgi:hypothetical protein